MRTEKEPETRVSETNRAPEAAKGSESRAEDAIAYIHGAQMYSRKAGLSNMRRLLALLGNPHQHLRFVHVAGTNGKGSTCAMIEAVLRVAGLRTGLYTSPYLQVYNERIRIAGEVISDEALVESFLPVREAVEQLRAEDVRCTTFEIGTAVAFLAFERAQVEIVVAEVGIGGIDDPTNVITPLVCAIAAIGLDHTEILGDSLEQIAAKKAGIAKAGVPLVLHPAPPNVERVVRVACQQAGAPLIALSGQEVCPLEDTMAGQRFDFALDAWQLPGVSIPLHGAFQLGNAAVALTVVHCLREAGMPIPTEAIYQGMAQTYWPGRLEWWPSKPQYLLDGAHNAQGMRALRTYVQEHLAGQERVLLSAVLEDKARDEMLDVLARLSETVVCTQVPGQPRAWPAEALAAALAQRGCQAIVREDFTSAMREAGILAGPEGVVLCTGSLYLVGAVRQVLEEGR